MIHVVARSAKSASLFSERHPWLSPEFHKGTRSYFDLINDLVRNGSDDFACIVHDDVFLPRSFSTRVSDLIASLNSVHPNWGVSGNAGVLSFAAGLVPTSVIRYISDPHGGPNLQGVILPAQSIDGNVMLLNLAAMRQRGVEMPAFVGFQFYDIALCIETLYRGLGVFIAPHLACYHDSKGSQASFDAAAISPALREYLTSRVVNRYITTLNGRVELGHSSHQASLPGRFDIELAPLRNAAPCNPKKTVAIIIRSQFARPNLLKRTLETTQAFLAACGDTTKFIPFVITDRPNAAPDFVSRYAQVIEARLNDIKDSRYKLVEHAAKNIEADYCWFIDDDDWLFPNEAQRLALVINSAPRNSTFFVDTQHFKETISESSNSVIGGSYTSLPGRYFYGRDFRFSLAGFNFIPFCGVIVSRQALLEAPQEAYDRVTYFEDFSVILHVLMDPRKLPIVVGKLCAGISVRGDDNTITEQDRTKWNQSASELVSLLVSEQVNPSLFTLPSWSNVPASVLTNQLSGLSPKERRVVLALRVLRTLCRVLTQPRRWGSMLDSAHAILVAEGFRGVLRQMAINGSDPRRT